MNIKIITILLLVLTLTACGLEWEPGKIDDQSKKPITNIAKPISGNSIVASKKENK